MDLVFIGWMGLACGVTCLLLVGAYRRIDRLETLVGILWAEQFPDKPSGEAIREFEAWRAAGSPGIGADPRYTIRGGQHVTPPPGIQKPDPPPPPPPKSYSPSAFVVTGCICWDGVRNARCPMHGAQHF
jgi:hypothetical protein